MIPRRPFGIGNNDLRILAVDPSASILDSAVTTWARPTALEENGALRVRGSGDGLVTIVQAGDVEMAMVKTGSDKECV